MPLTTLLPATAPLTTLRSAIYEKLGVLHCKNRSYWLRKRCEYAKGLDLRRRSDVVCLAQHLKLIAEPVMPRIEDEIPAHIAQTKDWPQRQAQICHWGLFACKGDDLALSAALVHEAQAEDMAGHMAGVWRA